MDIQTQLQIPPPVQHDGLHLNGHALPPAPHHTPVARQPEHEPNPFDMPQPTGRIRTRLRKAHRRLSPLMIFVGYVTSAGAGIGLAVLILKYAGMIDANWNIR